VRTRTTAVVTVALLVVGFALILLGGWMTHASAPNDHCAAGVPCAPVGTSEVGSLVQNFGSLLVFAALIMGIVAVVAAVADRTAHGPESR
jgi:urea transporter